MASTSFRNLKHRHSMMKAQAKKANFVSRKIDLSSERYYTGRNSLFEIGDMPGTGRGVDISSKTSAKIRNLPIGNNADRKKGDDKLESLSRNYNILLNLFHPGPLGSEKSIFPQSMENDH